MTPIKARIHKKIYKSFDNRIQDEFHSDGSIKNLEEINLRKSSHYLKVGLFGSINKDDNIYSKHNRRITMSSVEINKSRNTDKNSHLIPIKKDNSFSKASYFKMNHRTSGMNQSNSNKY